MSELRAMPTPQRVVMTTDTVGGVWQYTLELAAGCAAAGAAVQIVTMGPGPDDERRREVERLDGVELRHLDVSLDWMAKDEEALREAADGLSCYLSGFSPDLLHLSGVSLAAFDWRVPVVSTMHSCLPSWWAAMRQEPLPREWRWHREVALRGLAAADRVIAPTAAFGDALQDLYGRVPRLRIVHNGRTPPPSSHARGKHPFALAAGRFWDDAKGLDTLDAAAARMDTPLVLAGPLTGPSGEGGRVRAARSCGSLPEAELHTLMTESAIFVSASRYEPFGLGVLEAAQRRCALVLSDIPTFRELWGGVAVFLSPDDPGAFARAVDELADDPARAERLGIDASQRARRYSGERMAARTLAVYRECITADLAIAVAEA